MTDNNHSELFNRSSGILLHLSSLPGYWDSGDMGPAAETFIDLLSNNKQSLWQILPLTIPDMTGSPYSSYSAFAANINFISPEKLCNSGFCSLEDIHSLERTITDPLLRKKELLKKLAENQNLRHKTREEWDKFQSNNDYWLTDYALFTSLMKHFSPLWVDWPEEYRNHQESALKIWKKDHADELDLYIFEQFIFNLQ